MHARRKRGGRSTAPAGRDFPKGKWCPPAAAQAEEHIEGRATSSLALVIYYLSSTSKGGTYHIDGGTNLAPTSNTFLHAYNYNYKPQQACLAAAGEPTRLDMVLGEMWWYCSCMHIQHIPEAGGFSREIIHPYKFLHRYSRSIPVCYVARTHSTYVPLITVHTSVHLQIHTPTLECTGL